MDRLIEIFVNAIHAPWSLKLAAVDWSKHFLLSGLAAYLLTSTITSRGAGPFTRFWQLSLVLSFSVLAHIMLDYVR